MLFFLKHYNPFLLTVYHSFFIDSIAFYQQQRDLRNLLKTSFINILFAISIFLSDLQTFCFLGVLTINVYNEQIFTVLYIWMNIVLAVTTYNFVSWLIFLFFPRLRYSFFTQRVHIQQSASTVRTGMHAFVYDYLQHDGFFILRLIHSNVGDDVTSTILTNLWRNFQRPDKQSSADNSVSATVSLTATGNRGLYNRNEGQASSLFDYSKASTNL
jgi:hypothetical protein